MILLSIPTMATSHDRTDVEVAVAALPGAELASVDLDLRQAEVGGTATPADILAALDAAGHPADLR
ncbi:heavy-metal-associated domain-containing protein [Falsirhodobacter halotolerans]|uniref:heavy-metal-associated domain-containing protein n=1 Tax=Falsirhodobacter halotolerans TaxID=1146892 RepID=UPI001FD46273|nr:heavy metal-associated domain-containing protein [Falsirhodobacter halotolerans]MCJ8139708.1 heavy-metal-associated domain-containing protein [Falsirhodobacter halotolerans]